MFHCDQTGRHFASGEGLWLFYFYPLFSSSKLVRSQLEGERGGTEGCGSAVRFFAAFQTRISRAGVRKWCTANPRGLGALGKGRGGKGALPKQSTTSLHYSMRGEVAANNSAALYNGGQHSFVFVCWTFNFPSLWNIGTVGNGRSSLLHWEVLKSALGFKTSNWSEVEWIFPEISVDFFKLNEQWIKIFPNHCPVIRDTN